MPINLRWVVSVSASCFHAVAALDVGRSLVEPKLATALAPGVAALGALFDAGGLTRQRFFRHLVPLSAGIENNRELVTVAWRKAMGFSPEEVTTSHLNAALAGLKLGFQGELPGLLDQLELRAAPLVEQWEARGPGLLTSVGRLTEADLVVEQADVILVYPALGGGGEAHLPYNSVRIEAVLANPHVQLPEVVRLAWLVSQLSLDLPKYSEKIDRSRLARVAALAMIPPVLAAAEQVELARDDEATLRLALAVWDIPSGPTDTVGQPTTDIDGLAGTLDTWWRTFTDAPAPFPVALAALDQMLELPSTADPYADDGAT
jgi:hypothetical protein